MQYKCKPSASNHPLEEMHLKQLLGNPGAHTLYLMLCIVTPVCAGVGEKRVRSQWQLVALEGWVCQSWRKGEGEGRFLERCK